MKNKFRKIIVTLAFSGIYLLANPIQNYKKEDFLKQNTLLNENENENLINNNSTKITNGSLKKPFYNQQGKPTENIVKVIYNNNEGGQTEILLKDNVDSIKDMNNKYSKALLTAKDYSLTYSYVKVEAILKTESKNKEEIKRVVSIFNGYNDIKNSEVHFVNTKS